MINNILDKINLKHIIFFIVLGALFPNNYIGAFIIGVSWIILEKFMNKRDITKDLLVNHLKSYKDLWNNENKLIDLIINMIGYYLGNKIRGFSPL